MSYNRNGNGTSHLFRKCKKEKKVRKIVNINTDGRNFGYAGPAGSGRGSQEGSSDGDDPESSHNFSLACSTRTTTQNQNPCQDGVIIQNQSSCQPTTAVVTRKKGLFRTLVPGTLFCLMLVAALAGCPSPTNEPSKTGTENVQGGIEISGTLENGQTLTINFLNGSSEVGAIYKWTKTKDGQTTTVAGADGRTFVLTDAEIGYVIGAIVSYADKAGTLAFQFSPESTVGAAEQEQLLGSVSIDGVAKVNQPLTANTTALTNAVGERFSYRWQVGGADIAGATQKTFKIPAAQFGQEITVVVTSSGNTGSVASEKTAAVGMPVFENVSISINGVNLLGDTLSATVNDPEGNAWDKNNKITEWYDTNNTNDTADDTKLATAETYELKFSDVGKKLRAEVSFANGAATATTSGVVPEPKFNVSLSGPGLSPEGNAQITNPTQSISMTHNFNDEHGNRTVVGDPNVLYSWKAGGTEVGTGQSLTIISAYEGQTITGNAIAAEYKGWTPPMVPMLDAGTVKLKNHGSSEERAIYNKSSLLDTGVPTASFSTAYTYNTIKNHTNIIKFAKVSIVFVDKSYNSPMLSNGHFSEVKNVTGNRELVIYVDPAAFAEKAVGLNTTELSDLAERWLRGELAFYNALTKAAPAKQTGDSPVFTAKAPEALSARHHFYCLS